MAASMTFFPLQRMKRLVFGDLHAQGKDVIYFYTDRQVYIERWPGA